ncbi:MAG: DUF4112 domain-containing protein [Prevotella sp.]|nr:DUF4112 domain-containing protein [Prevotella sp.]
MKDNSGLRTADAEQLTADAQRRQRLMSSRAWRTMHTVARLADRYYLDALVGLIPGWGDAVALVSAVPFVYFSACVVRSLPLTLAVLNNALRDVLLGMLPFFVGDVIDIFHRSCLQNLAMIQGFVDGDAAVIRRVRSRALQSAALLLLLLLLIALMAWLLVALGRYLAGMF